MKVPIFLQFNEHNDDISDTIQSTHQDSETSDSFQTVVDFSNIHTTDEHMSE